MPVRGWGDGLMGRWAETGPPIRPSAYPPARSGSTTLATDEPPELPLADHLHDRPLRGETLDLHELQAAARAGDLQRVGPPPHQDVGRAAGLGLHDRPGALGGRDRELAGPAEETGERHALAREARHAAEVRLGPGMTQRRDELGGGFVALATHPQAAVDHLLEMIAAR